MRAFASRHISCLRCLKYLERKGNEKSSVGFENYPACILINNLYSNERKTGARHKNRASFQQRYKKHHKASSRDKRDAPGIC